MADIGVKRAAARQVLPWAVAALALMAHAVAVTAVVQRALAFRAGAEPEPPAILRLFNDVTHRHGPGADFFAAYHAGVQAGRGENPYAREPDGRTPYFYDFRYLPAFAHFPGRALATLPPWTAFLAWLALLELLLVGIGIAILRRLPRDLVPWAAALLLGSSPYWLELHIGQFSFVTGALICATALALRRDRVRAGLAAWAAAVFVKVYPLVLLPVWLRLHRLRSAAFHATAVLAPSVLLFLAAPEQWRRFAGLNFQAYPFDAGVTGNYSLLHLIGQGLVLGLEAPGAAWLAFARAFQVLVLGLGTLAVWRWGRERPALAVVVMTLAHHLSFYHVWEHHYSMIVPLGLIAAVDLGRREQLLVLGALAFIALPTPFIFWDIPGYWDPGPQWPLLQQMTLPALKALPAVVIALVATYGMRAAHRVASDHRAHPRPATDRGTGATVG